MADAKKTAGEPQTGYGNGRCPGKKAVKCNGVLRESYSIVVADRIMSKLAESGSMAWSLAHYDTYEHCTSRCTRG
jgi:hypothetical protein